MSVFNTSQMKWLYDQCFVQNVVNKPFFSTSFPFHAYVWSHLVQSIKGIQPFRSIIQHSDQTHEGDMVLMYRGEGGREGWWRTGQGRDDCITHPFIFQPNLLEGQSQLVMWLTSRASCCLEVHLYKHAFSLCLECLPSYFLPEKKRWLHQITSILPSSVRLKVMEKNNKAVCKHPATQQQSQYYWTNKTLPEPLKERYRWRFWKTLLRGKVLFIKSVTWRHWQC